MVNFIEAYKSGLNSAELAEKNKKEVDSVFSDLNQQLKEVTDGRIVILQRQFLQRGNLPSFIDMVTGNYYSEKEDKNPFVPGSDKELARWSQDRSGYPCKIILGSETMYCQDKKGLENGLATLLRDPVVGETLRNLQYLPLPEQTSIETSDGSIDLEATDGMKDGN
jgi:hypothetical protein